MLTGGSRSISISLSRASDSLDYDINYFFFSNRVFESIYTYFN